MPRIIFDDDERTFEVLLDLAVELNLRFYHASAGGRMVYRDHNPKHDTLFAIERVRQDKHLRKKVRRIAERFPADRDVRWQAAYLLRAFSGLQLFPDGNHRTGLAIMREHLHMNGQHFNMAGPPLARFIHAIRDRRSPYCTRCTVNGLNAEDRPFFHILTTITANCRPLTVGELVAVQYPRIGELFPGLVRPPPLVTPYADEDPHEEQARKA